MKNFNFLNLGTIYTNFSELRDSLHYEAYCSLQRSVYVEYVRKSIDLEDELNRKLNED